MSISLIVLTVLAFLLIGCLSFDIRIERWKGCLAFDVRIGWWKSDTRRMAERNGEAR